MAQSFYIRLLTLVDDFGRHESNPILLRSLAFPLQEDVKSVKVKELCAELASATGSDGDPLVLFYRSSGKEYLQITRWKERSRSASSRFPTYSNECELMYSARIPQRNAAEREAAVFVPPVPPVIAEAESESSDKCKGSLDEVKAFCAKQKLTDTDAEWFFNKCEGCGWTNNGRKIKDWMATIRAWKATGRIFPSQVNSGNSQMPLFLRIRTLDEKIATHPCNREFSGYNPNATPDQKSEYQSLKAKLAELKGGAL